ncbi:hypothetical protein LX99_03978 [Mucilaginibacter oryzae]|uniref:Uncharacterized protein n=1 Tax=Mucilaginibacter oryzae TaxID=468058 RepID=A0A316H2S5_9SPHI|nr:hypothetical protein [Mucilaginibacter oryzae]PWK74177.1 hypothetical protein LX99_03978 [Mucilaginibacter oryzae]
MITVPALPTDSLYKFLFVFGIILLITGGYFATEVNKKYRVLILHVDSVTKNIKFKSLNLTKNTDSLKKQLDYLDKTVSKNQKKMDSLGKSQFHNHKDFILSKKQSANLKIEKIKLAIELDKLKNKHAELEKKWKEISDDGDKAESIINYQTINMDFYIWFPVIVIFLGCIFTGLGGFRWYFKIQYYQDKILEMQYLQLKKDIEKKGITGRSHHEPLNHKRVRK